MTADSAVAPASTTYWMHVGEKQFTVPSAVADPLIAADLLYWDTSGHDGAGVAVHLHVNPEHEQSEAFECALEVHGEAGLQWRDWLLSGADERQAYADFFNGNRQLDPAFRKVGYDAHAAGKQFHECPYAEATFRALSWRCGWNDRALEAP